MMAVLAEVQMTGDDGQTWVLPSWHCQSQWACSMDGADVLRARDSCSGMYE